MGRKIIDLKTNTDCTKEIFGWTRIKNPTWEFGSLPSHYSMVCENDNRFTNIKKCRYSNDNPSTVRLYYDTTDNKLLSITPVHGTLCRRIVSPEWMRERFGISVSGGDAGAISTLDGSGSIRNKYFSYISMDKALDLMVMYMYSKNINKGIFVVQTFYTWKEKKKKGMFKRKVIIHFVEKPIYYIIQKGANAGRPLIRSYYLLDGQAVGNTLQRYNNEIYQKSKSGWTALGIAIIQSLVVATAVFTGGTTAGIIFGTQFAIQDIKNGVFEELISGGDGVYDTEGIWVDTTAAATTLGTASIVMNDNKYDNNLNITAGDGASHITSRVIYGNDLNTNGMSGYTEFLKQKNAFINWDETPGGFINDD